MMHLTDLAQRSRSSHDTSYAPHGVSRRLTVDQHLLSYDAAAYRSTYPQVRLTYAVRSAIHTV